jgi:hypothetical protein
MINIVDINVADIRTESKFRSERISQALFNEQVEILSEENDYIKVKQHDSYKGWILKAGVIEIEGFKGDGPFKVINNFVHAYINPDSNSSRITSLPYGCELYGEDNEDFLRVSSKRYGHIYVEKSNLIPHIGAQLDSKIIKSILRSETEKFLSVPYLWGGRSFFGIDCSGFSQTIMRRFNIELPRDSKDQMKIGTEVAREDIELGDLLFYPGHVAIALANSLFIHSSSSNGGVAINSFDNSSPIYSENLDKIFITARRVIE